MLRRRLLRSAVLTALLALTAAPAAHAAKPHSPDDLAPPDAPAHWLPPEPWIYNHWLPYDEGRLYRVLHITRDGLWEQLRDDHRTLAQLAARHGYPDPKTLAAKLVATRDVSATQRVELQRRAERTITQGHLAQHLFFHSLHQFAIPSAAPDIFGVTDAAFRNLRRQELSPLAIGRVHGRSPGRVEGAAIAVLRERIAAGIAGGDLTRQQAAILLRRQLTQLPRWLDQARYNGPPLTHRGALIAKPRDYASNPAISRDGRYVAYEGYRQKLPIAVKLGEIAVLRADLDGGPTSLISAIAPGGKTGPDPISAYNPAISADGRLVTYESSRGNQNFAKRYGRIGALVCDLGTHATDEVDRPDAGVPESLSSYNPAMAAGGTRMIYEAVRKSRTVIVGRDVATGRQRTVVAGARAGGTAYADPYEPSIAADGQRVVYTLASGRLGQPRSARSSVVVRDLARGTTTTVAGARPGAFAANPAISPDGRFVAYTATARGTVALRLHNLATGKTIKIPTGQGRPLDPVVADGGTTVAFTSVRGGHALVLAWSAATGTVSIVSRASGAAGPVGAGWSDTPSISGDGRRVAFASDAPNLDPAKRDTSRAIVVRDLTTSTTRVVSDLAVAYGAQG